MKLDNETQNLIQEEIKELEQNARFLQEKRFPHHCVGKHFFNTESDSVYSHSVHVAVLSCKIVKRFNIKLNKHSLIKGALLHDYFLYNWRDKNSHEGLHGFVHAEIAVRNAKEDCDINAIEEDVIRHHMFPLTLTPPHTVEGCIVCIADKLCALCEVMKPYLSICSVFLKRMEISYNN